MGAAGKSVPIGLNSPPVDSLAILLSDCFLLSYCGRCHFLSLINIDLLNNAYIPHPIRGRARRETKSAQYRVLYTPSPSIRRYSSLTHRNKLRISKKDNFLTTQWMEEEYPSNGIEAAVHNRISFSIEIRRLGRTPRFPSLPRDENESRTSTFHIPRCTSMTP